LCSGAVALLLAGCAHGEEAGTGTGTVVSRSAAVSQPASLPVRFSWTSNDGGLTGVMTARLGSRTFTGRFQQAHEAVQTDAAAPLWRGRRPRWRDWAILGTWSAGDIVAKLSSPDGAQMRCRFYVPDPASGIEKGGEGECQEGSETITAVLDTK